MPIAISAGATDSELITGQTLSEPLSITLPVLGGVLHCSLMVAEVVAPAVTLKLAEPAQWVPVLPASVAVRLML